MKMTAAVGAFEIEELELFQSQAVETGLQWQFKKSCDLRVHFLVEVTTSEDRRESSPSCVKYAGDNSDGMATSDPYLTSAESNRQPLTRGQGGIERTN